MITHSYKEIRCNNKIHEKLGKLLVNNVYVFLFLKGTLHHLASGSINEHILISPWDADRNIEYASISLVSVYKP